MCFKNRVRTVVLLFVLLGLILELLGTTDHYEREMCRVQEPFR